MAVDVLRGRADTVTIEVTSKCNLRCSYCPKADPDYDALPDSNMDMSDDSLENLYQYCKKNGIGKLSLSGVGETAMIAGWHLRLSRFLDDPAFENHLVSNFTRVLTNDDLEALCKLQTLQVSFDSSDFQTVRRMRSKADLGTITYNIVRLRQKAHELKRPVHILVNCTLSRQNIAHLADLAAFCSELGVDRLLITEMMLPVLHNDNMPETLDSLTSKEILLLARQIIAAEDVLSESDTGFDIQDHLRLRIGEIIEQLREGTVPLDAHNFFHRELESSACRQPWTQPFVRADGRVYACCMTAGGPLGRLQENSLEEIWEGADVRKLRASIMDGRSHGLCAGCSLANATNFREFADDITEWQGGARVEHDSELHRVMWPGLFREQGHEVLAENAIVTTAPEEFVLLTEDRHNGLHRVLIDFDPLERPMTVELLVRPAGRRRLRLDIANVRQELTGRVLCVLANRPVATVQSADTTCNIKKLRSGLYSITLVLSANDPMSHINLTLMREDNAVVYAGDGRSGCEIGDFRIAEPPSCAIHERAVPLERC